MAGEGSKPPAAEQSLTVHHRGARSRRPRQPGGMQLNLPAMIDVVFLLLIFFVVTATFTEHEGSLRAHLPVGEAEQPDELEPPTQPVEIRLRSTGLAGVWIDLDGVGRLSTFSSLRRELEAIQYDPERHRTAGFVRPEDPIVIQPEQAVRWQHVVNAFNAAVGARYENVSFARPE